MSEKYIETNLSTAQLNKQATGESALSINKIENGIESSKVQNFWDDYRAVIIILIIIFLTAFAILISLLVILWPKFNFNLKSHPNYSKFSRDSCTLNYTINFKDDLSSLHIPWLVRILRKNGTEDTHSCTAVLIANDLILTAAHCLDEDDKSKISGVLLSGTFDNNFNNIIRREFLKLIPHPDYEFDNDIKTADIGLLKISKPLSFSSSFYPVYLPFDNSDLPDDLSLIQWLYPDIEKMNIEKTEVAIMNSEQCYEQYKNAKKRKIIKFFEDEERVKFCVDYDAIKSSKGESGFPGIKTDDSGAIVYGILISGGNEKSPLPDLYVAAHAYLRWILDNA